MKYLQSILEFSNKDRRLLLSSGINDLFTVAFEFELETDDKKLITKSYQDEISKQFIDELTSILGEKGISYDNKTLHRIIELIDFSDIEDTYEMLDYESEGIKDEILDILYYLVDKYEDSFGQEQDDTNLDYGVQMVEKHLPNFYKKYGDELKFVFDGTLERGIEFSPKKYVFSLVNAIEMINYFFTDFDKQNYWKMKKTTSIHINLGFTKPVEWNITKGLVMIGETKKDDVPFVFKDIEQRVDSSFTKSILQDSRIKLLKYLDKHPEVNTVKEYEKLIERYLTKSVKEWGIKTFAVNIERIKNDNYVEFRHVGGKVTKELVIDKLMYFAYIAYLMTTDYKDADYHKKLYKYVKDVDPGTPKDEFVKNWLERKKKLKRK